MTYLALRGAIVGSMLCLTTPFVPDADAQRPHAVSGQLRELRCRGKPGINLRVHKDPSPHNPKFVTMELRYDQARKTRSLAAQGMATVDHGVHVEVIPGSCSWFVANVRNQPPEPGVVYFDIERDAQAWTAPGARDTTIDAAVNFPDIVSLPRYLSDSTRWWMFYVDDVSNVSISFGRYPRGGGLPPIVYGGTSRDSAGGTTRSGVRTDSAKTTARSTRSNVAGARGTTTRTPNPGAIPPGAIVGDARGGSAGSAASSGTRTQPKEPAASRALPKDSAATRSAAAAVGERRLTNLRTAPGPMGVRITFDAVVDGLLNQASRVRGTISAQPPTQDPVTRKWSFPPWHAFMSTEVRSLGGGAFEVVPTFKLDAGRRYHYLIEVHSKDATSPAQRTGSFTADIRHPLKGN